MLKSSRSSTNAFILLKLPVSAIIMDSLDTSTILALNISAIEDTCCLFSGPHSTLIITSSLHTDSCAGSSTISLTSISLLSCFSICSSTSSSPVTAIVIRDNSGLRVSPTVRLSILYPLRLNIPATRLSTPDELPTRIEKTARLIT